MLCDLISNCLGLFLDPFLGSILIASWSDNTRGDFHFLGI